MGTAWRRTAPAILASNVTVVLALLTLAPAVTPGLHGLGVSSAIVLAAVLFALPPLLAVCGRKVFWPFIPHPGAEGRDGRVWRAIAFRVARRPAASLLGGVALLAVMAVGLSCTSVGLDQTERFRVRSESAAGLEVLSARFPAGEAQPIHVIADSAAVDEVLSAVDGVEGVVRAHEAGTSGDGTLARTTVAGEYAGLLGPLVGGVFAFGIARGRLQVLRVGDSPPLLPTAVEVSPDCPPPLW